MGSRVEDFIKVGHVQNNTHGSFSRADGTIRPFSDPTKCLYHKMNGYTVNEKPYISTCFDHNRYMWIRRDSGAIMSANRWTSTPHCLSIPDPTNTRKKQQVTLQPCDDN